jgi:predicted PurR-regulated permease PerM
MDWLKPWVVFAGWVLVIAVLYLAQAVIVPVALAALLTFLLTPLVIPLERRIGRIAAVMAVVILTFSTVGIVGWAFARQLGALAQELPRYRQNIEQKLGQVERAGKEGSLGRVQQTIEEIQARAEGTEAKGVRSQPLVVTPERTSWGFTSWLSPLVTPLSSAGFVVALVIFMLLDRQDLRNRLLQLVAHGHLAVTTKAFDEAATRVSRFLLTQSLVNAIYGTALGTGLYLLGVPYPILWACFGAAARFIPYVGPLMASAGPLFVSFAALPGWRPVLLVAGFVGLLELVTNMVLETVLYAGAAGVSEVALLVAAAFWTWLWGPLGLLMATPLTVCLVVIGKHMQSLEMIATLMADTPALDPQVSYYQRLLARDQSEASELIEQYVADKGSDTVYDELMLPALNYAERDHAERRLSQDEEAVIIALTRELMLDVPRPDRESSSPEEARATESAPAVPAGLVIGYPVNGEADAVALQMLDRLVPGLMEIASGTLLVSQLVTTVRENNYRVVCIVDLPPSPSSKTRYIVKKLRAALPDIKILVGRWAPPSLLNDDTQALIEAGANYVGTTLVETRRHLREMTQHFTLTPTPRTPVAA